METNARIQEIAARLFAQRKGPCEGDFVRRKDGTYVRICDVQSASRVQLADARFGESIFLEYGVSSYSGGCGAVANIRPTTETRRGRFWHFDQGIARAHAAVQFECACRVYVEV